MRASQRRSAWRFRDAATRGMLRPMRRGTGLTLLGVLWLCASCQKVQGGKGDANDGVEPENVAVERSHPSEDSRGTKSVASTARPDASSKAKEAGGTTTPAPQAPKVVRPPSPFRKVVDAPGGYLFQHGGDLLYAGEQVIQNLSSGAVLASCNFLSGYLMSGRNLYFAARMSPYSACPDEPFLVEHVGKSWKLRRFIDAHDLMLDEWVAGTTLAAVVPYRLGPPWGYELVRVSGGATPPKPMKGASHPSDSEQKCYSELQSPSALHAFPSGVIMVVGEARCEFSGRTGDDSVEGEAASEEEKMEDGEASEQEESWLRPVIEYFAPGSYRSTVVSLPIHEVISSIDDNSSKLFMIGKVRQSTKEDAPFEKVLLSFDGKEVRRFDVDLEDVDWLVRGPQPSPSERTAASGVEPPSEGSATGAVPPPDSLWFSGEEWVRRASGEGEPLWYPESCESPLVQFWRGHAWLACDDGIYTTDPEQEPIVLAPVESGASCEALSPRPEYAVPGIYKKSSSVGGCSRRHSFDLGSGKSKKVMPDGPAFDPWGQGPSRSELPRPQRPPSNLKLEF